MKRILLLLSAFLAPPAAAAETPAAVTDLLASDTVAVVLRARQEAVLSAEVDTLVLKIEKEMGRSFAAGEPLMRLDARKYEQSVAKTRAILAAAQAKLKTTEKLYRDGNAREQDYEAARRDVAIAEANLAVAEQELAACTVRAPYPGRVVKVHVDAYNYVEEGDKLLHILDDRVLRAVFLLPDRFYTRVRKGQTLTITLEEDDRPLKVTVTHISPKRDDVLKSFDVFAEVANQDRALQAGTSARLDLKQFEDPAP